MIKRDGGVKDQSGERLCSEFKIEHLQPNCCLDTQITGNYSNRLQWGENRWYCQRSTNYSVCGGDRVSGSMRDSTCVSHSKTEH